MLNNQLRCSPRAVCRTTAIAVLVAAISTPALAAPPLSPQAPETTSTTVSLSGLDLTTPRGLKIARSVITKAAKQLCRGWSDSRKIDDAESYAACVQETIANAVRQLPTSTLNAGN